MSNVVDINNFIQEKLEELNRNEITAVDMAEMLDKNGLLKDSEQRPGLPLRNLLRSGRIIGSHQYSNKRWVIRKQKTEKKLTVNQAAKKLGISEQAVYKRIERGKIIPDRIGESIAIPISELEKELNEETSGELNDSNNKILKEIEGLFFEIENLNQRVHNLKEIIIETIKIRSI